MTVVGSVGRFVETFGLGKITHGGVVLAEVKGDVAGVGPCDVGLAVSGNGCQAVRAGLTWLVNAVEVETLRSVGGRKRARSQLGVKCPDSCAIARDQIDEDGFRKNRGVLREAVEGRVDVALGGGASSLLELDVGDGYGANGVDEIGVGIATAEGVKGCVPVELLLRGEAVAVELPTVIRAFEDFSRAGQGSGRLCCCLRAGLHLQAG